MEKIEFKGKKYNTKYYSIRNCVLCDKQFIGLVSRNPRFCGNACSTKSTANSKDRIDKIKSTKLERYGSETYVNPEKAKLTCFEKYGVDNVSKSQIVIDKIKETNREKFGSDWFFASEVGKEKIKESNMEKYGVENPSSINEVKEKRKNTIINKYGRENFFSNVEGKDLVKNSLMEKYGIEHPSESQEFLSKRSKNNIHNNFDKIVFKQNIIEVCEPMFSIEEYKTTDRKNLYKFKCKKCESVFEDSINGGKTPRCSTCFPKITGSSIAEKEILEFIKSLLPTDDIHHNVRPFENKGLDIYIPNKKIAIEYNGLYWHSENHGNRGKNYHIDKSNTCLKNGVRLIQIFEDEWINKQEIVKSKIKSILGVRSIEKSIYARKVNIQRISSSMSSPFLDKYHIQGKCNSPIRYGAFFGGELVGVMTIGKLRISMGHRKNLDGEFELIRFATSKSVTGLASKMLSVFIKEFSPTAITSYSDNRWSSRENAMYAKIGFEKISETPPNYFYIQHGYPKRYHRFGFAKHTLKNKLKTFDSDISEWENMKSNGYDRIWDCGTTKWVWKKYRIFNKYDKLKSIGIES